MPSLLPALNERVHFFEGPRAHFSTQTSESALMPCQGAR